MDDDAALNSLYAISQKTRWDIFWLLIGEDLSGCSASTIGSRLNVSPPTLSFHLKQLTDAGFLHSYRQGRYVFYKADCTNMDSMLLYLTNKCNSVRLVSGN